MDCCDLRFPCLHALAVSELFRLERMRQLEVEHKKSRVSKRTDTRDLSISLATSRMVERRLLVY